MKKIYIVIIGLIILVVGAMFLFGMGKQAEAPVSENTNIGDEPITTTPISPIVACTMEAKMCPDGSYVGRTGPKCEFTACPEIKDTTSKAVKEFIVTGQNFSFTPSTITVKKGDKVKITFNNTSGFHDFVIDAYGVATKASQSPDTEILEFTADKVGSFEYYCSVGTHRAMGMKGILKVE